MTADRTPTEHQESPPLTAAVIHEATDNAGLPCDGDHSKGWGSCQLIAARVLEAPPPPDGAWALADDPAWGPLYLELIADRYAQFHVVLARHRHRIEAATLDRDRRDEWRGFLIAHARDMHDCTHDFGGDRRDQREGPPGLDVEVLAEAIDARVPYTVSGNRTYKRRITGADAAAIAAEYARLAATRTPKEADPNG